MDFKYVLYILRNHIKLLLLHCDITIRKKKHIKLFKILLPCRLFVSSFKINYIKRTSTTFILKKKFLNFIHSGSLCEGNRWAFFWQDFQLQCVGLRQAALNNLKLLRKNSQLCPV